MLLRLCSRYFQLVARILCAHGRRGPGGEPDGLGRGPRADHRAGGPGAAVPQGLELCLRRRVAGARRRLSASPPLTTT